MSLCPHLMVARIFFSQKFLIILSSLKATFGNINSQLASVFQSDYGYMALETLRKRRRGQGAALVKIGNEG